MHRPPASGNQLYFLALMPPEDLQAGITAIKQDFARRYGAAHALRTPPHITLVPPFPWPAREEGRLCAALKRFAAGAQGCDIRLEGFGAFRPRVVFLRVTPCAELAGLQAELESFFRCELCIGDAGNAGRPFHPHLTIATHDLEPDAFQRAWAEFENRPFSAAFRAGELVLLRHRREGWEVAGRFALPDERG
jgi:2'-5' RNA ligase